MVLNQKPQIRTTPQPKKENIEVVEETKEEVVVEETPKRVEPIEDDMEIPTFLRRRR